MRCVLLIENVLKDVAGISKGAVHYGVESITLFEGGG